MYYEPTKEQAEDSDEMLEYADALLWADAGTGKTVTAMEAVRKGGFEKVIVICPKMAVSMWKEELEKHLKYASQIGNGKYVAKVKATGGFKKGEGIHHADALITTFGIARSWYKSEQNIFLHFKRGGKNERASVHYRKDRPYKTVLIVDEAHYLKDRLAQQTQAVFNLSGQGYFTAQFAADSLWQLTGTPSTRYWDDLWTQLKASRPEILQHHGVSTYEQFVRTFCRTKMIRRPNGTMQRVVCGNTNTAKLQQLLADCKVIRRKLEDVVASLPPITHRIVDAAFKGVPSLPKSIINMTEAQFMSALAQDDGELAKVRRLLGLAKAKSVAEYAKEYGRKPVLIGFWHTDVGALLEEQLDAVVVSGATSISERDLIRERFNSGQIPFLAGQMAAMNTSWNLQELCRHVIIAEELPSPAMLHQFYSRVYRRGVGSHVQVDHMLSEHSIDVALRNIRLSKQADNERLGI